MPAVTGKAKGFVWLTVLVAAAVLLWFFPSEGFQDLQTAGTVIILGLMLFAAGLFPITVYKSRFWVTTALEYACILILSPAWAVWTVATSTFLYHAYFYNLRLKKRWLPTFFNTATLTLPTAAGAVVYRALAPTGGHLFTSWGDVLALSLAGIVFFAINTAIAATLQSLVEKKPFLWVWTVTNEPIIIHWVILGLLGLLAAIVHESLWWSVILLAFPMLAVYYSLKTSQALRMQTKEAVEALADIVDMRDPYTYGHSQRVAQTSEQLALQLGLAVEEVELIRAAARVHDIGKIVVDATILMKPARLSDEEWNEIRKHPKVGADILARFPDFALGREIVLQHHERFAGGGYPTGNRGDKIPLGARIVAVADSLDAMTSDRPYRKSLHLDTVIREFEHHSGTQWDPQVTKALLDILRQQQGERSLAASAVAT